MYISYVYADVLCISAPAYFCKNYKIGDHCIIDIIIFSIKQLELKVYTQNTDITQRKINKNITNSMIALSWEVLVGYETTFETLDSLTIDFAQWRNNY